MRTVKNIFWFLVASVFLIEAWLWDRIQPLIHAIVERLPLRRVKAFMRWLVGRLPPWAALFVMGIPAVVLFPAKLLGLWLLAKGQFIAGALLFLVAKSVGFVLVVFLFEICRPKLMQMDWFAKVFAWFVAARAWAHERVAPFKQMLIDFKRRALGENSAFSRKIAALRRRSRTH